MANRKLDQTNETTEQVAVVKKYANRRLYNTQSSSYVTLDELSQMVRDGKDFVVFDAKTGEDITRSVLTQIILEEDSKGRNLLPIKFLRQLIGFYDDSLHAFLPRYLELSMESFARNQDQMRSYMEETFGRFFPVNQFEDMARQNMAILQRATSMFSPFPAEGTAPAQPAPEETGKAEPGPELGAEVRELRDRMEALQKQLNELARPPASGTR